MIRTESRSDARSLTSRPAPGASRIAAVPLVLGVVFLALTRALAASPPAARKPAVNVILITIDTVRANHLGCYGAKDIQTPTLDALARDGIVFEPAISQFPLTFPSPPFTLTVLD